MNIVIKKGKIVRFTDSGSVSEQIKNFEKLIVAMQAHAANMQKVAARTLNVDYALMQANEELRRENAIAKNTINIADGQLRRELSERKKNAAK